MNDLKEIFDSGFKKIQQVFSRGDYANLISKDGSVIEIPISTIFVVFIAFVSQILNGETAKFHFETLREHNFFFAYLAIVFTFFDLNKKRNMRKESLSVINITSYIIIVSNIIGLASFFYLISDSSRSESIIPNVIEVLSNVVSLLLFILIFFIEHRDSKLTSKD